MPKEPYQTRKKPTSNTETTQQETQQENRRTLLNLDEFTSKERQETEIDSILKGPVEKKSFIPSESFTGQKDGYVFKNGRHGNGYYLDRHVKFNL